MISFFESVLPGVGTIEGKKFAAQLTLENSKSDRMEVLNRILELTKLLLNIAEQACAAIENHRYKEFDALIGNFGCQITAYDLQRKFRNLQLREEASKVRETARLKIAGLDQILGQGDRLPMIKILQQLKLDFSISAEWRDLFRFRLLKLIHANKLIGHVDVPWTNVKLLKVNETFLNEKTLKLLIRAIQLEESKKAASFIRQVASEMKFDENPRAAIIQRLLSENFEKRSKGIVSLPLVYNTEACLRNYQGVLLIKNKLSNCLGPIQGAVSQRVYLKMPGERILDEQQIASLPENEPLIVLEGIVMKDVSLLDVSLLEAIKAAGLIPLILSNCAEEPQFANLNEGDLGIIDDKVAQLDVEAFKKLNLKSTKFALDHFYCASAGEEK